MTWLTALWEFLASLFGKKPTPPVVTPPVVTPPAQPKRITSQDNFRTLPTITYARMKEITAGFPFEAEAEAIFIATGGRPLPLAQSYMESRYGQDENALATRNPLGLLWYDGSPISNYLSVNVGGGITVKLLKFPTWAAAFKEWCRRMDSPGYKNGVYGQDFTLEQMIFTYVGGPDCLAKGVCGNGETPEKIRHYLDQTINRYNRYLGFADPPTSTQPAGYKAHTIPGLKNPLLLPADIPVRTRMTAIGVAGRSGRKLQPPFQATRHTTNNPNPGTDAWMHARWQANGAEGNPGIAVHAYVDDREVVIAMPFDEQGIHSGDWRNQQSLATELTRQAGINRVKAEQNAIALDAGILHAIGGNVEQNLWPHTDGGHCPQLSITWPDYEARVNAALQKLKAA